MKERPVIVKLKNIKNALIGCTQIDKGFIMGYYVKQLSDKIVFLDMEENCYLIPFEWILWMAPVKKVIWEAKNGTSCDC